MDIRIKRYFIKVKNMLFWRVGYSRTREILLDMREYFTASFEEGVSAEEAIRSFGQHHVFFDSLSEKDRRIQPARLFLRVFVTVVSLTVLWFFKPQRLSGDYTDYQIGSVISMLILIILYHVWCVPASLLGVIVPESSEVRLVIRLSLFTVLITALAQWFYLIYLPDYFRTVSTDISQPLATGRRVILFVALFLFAFALFRYVFRAEREMHVICIQAASLFVSDLYCWTLLVNVDQAAFFPGWIVTSCYISLLYTAGWMFILKKRGQ